jgi:hypothetical protein
MGWQNHGILVYPSNSKQPDCDPDALWVFRNPTKFRSQYPNVARPQYEFFIAWTKSNCVWVFCSLPGPIYPASVKPEAGIRPFFIICPQNCHIFLSWLQPGPVASGTWCLGHNIGSYPRLPHEGDPCLRLKTSILWLSHPAMEGPLRATVTPQNTFFSIS